MKVASFRRSQKEGLRFGMVGDLRMLCGRLYEYVDDGTGVRSIGDANTDLLMRRVRSRSVPLMTSAEMKFALGTTEHLCPAWRVWPFHKRQRAMAGNRLEVLIRRE